MRSGPMVTTVPSTVPLEHAGFTPARSLLGNAPIESTRIRRAVVSAPAIDGGARALPRIRPMQDRATIIRRVISDEQWTDEVTPNLDRGATVTVWRGGEAFLIRKDGDDLMIKPTHAPDFIKLTDAQLKKMKTACTLTPEHLSKKPTFTAKPNKGEGFTVTEFEKEPLSLVHHTESSGQEKNAHLTVENAHVLAFEDLFSSPERDVRSKADLDKSKINTALTKTFGVGSVDNLNFYEPAKASKKPVKEKDKGPHDRLPLSGYLAFVAHALAIGGAPPQYGERIIAFANQMAADKKLDPSQLFMRVGMDEPAFVRAVLIIDSVLPTGSKLAISPETHKLFEKWWNVADNEGRVPYLPAPDAKEGDPLLRSGMQYKSESFSVIEVRYCEAHFAEFVKAINDFTPEPAVVAEAATTKKGKGSK